MENASKALIIAGAILVSIILISLGIMVMNSTGDVTSRMGEEMNSASIDSFNSKFVQYSGVQKGSTVKKLIGTIQSSNATSDHKVGIVNSTGLSGDTMAELQMNLKPTANYDVKVEAATSDSQKVSVDGTECTATKGYVYKITIK